MYYSEYDEEEEEEEEEVVEYYEYGEEQISAEKIVEVSEIHETDSMVQSR